MLNQDGQAVCWSGQDYDQADALPGHYLAISAGGGNTCVVTTDGAIVCWGRDLDEQSPPGRYTTVSTSRDHACALTEHGKAVCWGLASGLPEWNDFGEREAAAGRYVAISVGYREYFEISGDMRHYFANSCALSEDGEAVCWSYYDDDIVGTRDDMVTTRFEGPYTAITSMAGVGFCGVTRDGAAECRHQKWDPTFVTTAFSEALPPGIAPRNGEATRYTAVAASWDHVCALTAEGQAVCGTAPDLSGHRWVMHPPDPAPGRYIAIELSYSRACALTEGGEAVCWDAAANKVGAPDPPPGRYVAVNDGPFHTCALTEAREAVCWGWNNHRQADAPAGRYIAISAGPDHTCALTEDREAVCWGELKYAGKAPQGPLAAISAGEYSTCALTEEGEIACSGNADFNSKAPAGRFTAISSGAGHACAIHESGALKCWFSREREPNFEGRFMAVDVNGRNDDFGGPYYICALTTDGEAKCWGVFGPETSLPPGPFVEIAVGYWHSCALTADGEAVCWHGPEAPVGRYTTISASYERVCAVTVEGAVVCWGDTDYE